MKDLENLENEDQLLSMMEEMQDQIEELQTEVQVQIDKNSEAQKTISKLSLENLTLKNEVLKKSEIIISQNENIEKLSESDLVLKKNEELEKENTRLQNYAKKTEKEAEAARTQATKDIGKIKQEYETKESALVKREEGEGRRETLVSFKEFNIDREISNKAFKMVEVEMEVLASAASNQRKDLADAYSLMSQKLQRKYDVMMAGYKGMVRFTLFYAIITTVIMAFRTEDIRSDFMGMIHMIGKALMTVFDGSNLAGLYVAQLGDMIPNTTAAMIVHWILPIIVCVAFIGGLGVSIVLIGKKYVCFFRKRQADDISVYVGLFILATIVFMADVIKSILSINLFFVAIGLFIGYTVVRGITQAENTEAKKNILKWSGIAAGGIGTLLVMVHFFGIIGLIAMPIGLVITESN